MAETLGEDITALTKAGNIPSWSTLRSRYWKNKAFYFPDECANIPTVEGIDNLARMRAGKPPIVNSDKGIYTTELHYILGREGDKYYLFFEISPEGHVQIDKFRHIGK